MSEEELKKKYEIFCDAWRLYRKYAGKKLHEQDWEEILSEVDRITKKYGCELCYALCHVVMEEFERMEIIVKKKEEEKNGRCEMD